MNYRLDSPEKPAPYPTATHDIAAFNKYLAQNPNLAHPAPNGAVSIGGHSAGGHLALYQAANPAAPWRYACVVSVAGVTDLTDSALPAVLAPYITRFTPTPAEQRLASPVHRTSFWGAQGAIFIHAKDDPIVPWQQSERMAQILTAEKKSWVTVDFLQQGGHDLPTALSTAALGASVIPRCR